METMAKTKPTVNLASLVSVDKLKPHSRNYRKHPADQLEHIKASITEHGFYRNVVATKSGVILAGHGVVEASKVLGLDKVPVIQLDIDPESPQALRILTGDNYLSHFAEDDDRLLTELLKEVLDSDEGLLGTGFDEMMLANLAMVTRTEGELKDANAAAEWVGLPDFEPKDKPLQLIISFVTEDQRAECVENLGLKVIAKNRTTWSMEWNKTEKDDIGSARFTDDESDCIQPTESSDE